MSHRALALILPVDWLRGPLPAPPDPATGHTAQTIPADTSANQYTLLIQLAILGSPSKRLMLREILAALEDRFEWFRDAAGDAWKSITEPGKGHYWVVDYSQGEGNQCPRKCNKRPTKEEQARLVHEQSIVQRREEEESGSRDEEDVRGASIVEDANIDPQLRNQGHVVGEGRLRAGPATRSSTCRGRSPYTTSSSQGSPACAPLRINPTPTGPYRPSFDAVSTSILPHRVIATFLVRAQRANAAVLLAQFCSLPYSRDMTLGSLAPRTPWTTKPTGAGPGIGWGTGATFATEQWSGCLLVSGEWIVLRAWLPALPA
ncbi:Forkhead box protein F1 [Grifola frondosa]|uniref:Forkhead box protein F1 n=1 Tax=Grifola frondosa TaxID=5627 RepID=A0A1C7MNN2_GRIFR|nr:Forkhead box protein F1 [Grifola frondosa]